ncbi:MAG: prepilin peptidase [Candidatus Micrarchaeia archaeon]
MELLEIRVISILVIAAVYALFDVFNRRNVPNIFAYATLFYGLILSALYFNLLSLTSIAIAAIVLGIGYLIYKIGQIGGADVIEFAALSLILPIQPSPWFASLNQFNLPFIFSILINSGVIALVIVPIYYIIVGSKHSKRHSFHNNISLKSLFKATLMLCAYAIFIVFARSIAMINFYSVLLLLIIGIFSFLMFLFEDIIAKAMIEYVPPAKFEEGDIIALNFVDRKKIHKVQEKVPEFGRLVTSNILTKLKEKHIQEKFPVYKNAMPLALPILIGVIISLALGNMLLFIFPIS